MEKFFNINFEFNFQKVDETIFFHINAKKAGYVCSLDGNNFAIANTNQDHLQILNNSIVNNCDSSWIPVIINAIYGTSYTNYCGTDLFIKYVNFKRYRQFFLGSSIEVLNRLKNNLSKIDPKIKDMSFQPLPFLNVDDFNYKEIADMINCDNVDIIWISLGAPKQEKFMSLLLPHLKKGVMFGFGAIFNVYAEMPGLKRCPRILVNLKLEWLYRLIQEPKKQSHRTKLFLRTLPSIIWKEVKSKKFNKHKFK